jgi:hypothetical protein
MGFSRVLIMPALKNNQKFKVLKFLPLFLSDFIPFVFNAPNASILTIKN